GRVAIERASLRDAVSVVGGLRRVRRPRFPRLLFRPAVVLVSGTVRCPLLLQLLPRWRPHRRRRRSTAGCTTTVGIGPCDQRRRIHTGATARYGRRILRRVERLGIRWELGVKRRLRVRWRLGVRRRLGLRRRGFV